MGPDRWSEEGRRTRARSLEARLLLPEEEIPERDVDNVLVKPLRAQLLRAFDDELLAMQRHEIHQMVKSKAQDPDGCFMVVGGGRPPRASASGPWESFVREDGARFSFAITFQADRHRVRLLTYSYTFCFPGGGPQRVRWDLDLSGAHGDDGLRSHLHLDDEVRVPAPQLHPAEMLDLLLYRLGRTRGDPA